jgi:NAD(P)-dependent dehydrogenase (short-subunit alcohol dehydrogenase family)
VHLEALELAEEGSGVALAARVLERWGCPDVVVNNAGSLQFGPVEAVGPDEMERLFRINVFEQVALAYGFVPAMRERGSGTIVNVTSLGGRMTFPFFSVYNATKHALEGLSEGMWHELSPFGIRVKAVEPGFVETAIWGKVLPTSADELDVPAPYREAMLSMLTFEHAITDRTPPAKAAEEIVRAIADPSDRLRYPVAAYARPILRTRRILGDRFMMRFFHKKWLGDVGKG